MIQMKNITKKFGNIEILKNISLDINQGEIYGIIGHSGAGKSTLLRCINGLETYDSGSLLVEGREISELKGKEVREFRKDIGMIFQNFNLLKRKNVYANIALPLETWGYKTDFINKKVNELLELVGLLDKAKCKISELSGGQKQRVAIARALALEPKILICDEATSALDPKITKDVLQLLKKINKDMNITIVMVTHQMEVVREVCERIALIDGGIIKAEGKSEELFLRPGNALKKFLGEEDEEENLPKNGTNIRIFFRAESVGNALITNMAIETRVNASIVYGKLEKFRDKILGHLVINIDQSDEEIITRYLASKDIEWEVM